MGTLTKVYEAITDAHIRGNRFQILIITQMLNMY